MYSVAAQYNAAPDYPVTVVCSGIDRAPNGTDILGRIFAGVVAYESNRSYYDTNEYNYPSETNVGWKWQTCSEMVMPIGRGINDTMFPPSPFDLHQFIADCKNLYGVLPRPRRITTYFGGHDIKLILRRFASNIIFSNGLRDSYSTGGVLEDISKSVIVVTTVNVLASWFRLKYSHITLGALASSAPILYFDDITAQNGYYSKVTKDFKEVSKKSYETIRKSWSEIDRVASKPNGLSILSEKFKTCGHLNNSTELKDYLDSMYSVAAQYNAPPDYPVTVVCSRIDGAPNGTDILGRIFAGIAAYESNRLCYDTNEYNYPSETNVGWKWQDIKLILRRFASNIIFSNGLRDPYSTGGVLEDISKSVIGVTTINGSHCLDILHLQQNDPSWLVEQRKKEVETIGERMATYYADLLALKK